MTLRNRPLAMLVRSSFVGLVLATGLAQAQENVPPLSSNRVPAPPASVANEEDASDADTPSSAIIVLPPGTRPPVDLNDNPAARARIAEMLQRAQQNLGLKEQGRSPSDQPQIADPILNDVLDVIRHRGSVLDGSSLDEEANADTVPNLSDRAYSPPPRGSDRDHRYQVAESLLRSARLLQQLGSTDPEQAQLIRSLRQQALTLMIQSAAQENSSRQRGTPSY